MIRNDTGISIILQEIPQTVDRVVMWTSHSALFPLSSMFAQRGLVRVTMISWFPFQDCGYMSSG